MTPDLAKTTDAAVIVCSAWLAANRVMEVSISGGSPTTRRLFSALYHWLQIQRWPRHPRFLGLAGRARSSVLGRTPRTGCCEMAGSGKAFAPSRSPIAGQGLQLDQPSTWWCAVWYCCIRAAPVRGELSIAFSYSRMWCWSQLTMELTRAAPQASSMEQECHRGVEWSDLVGLFHTWVTTIKGAESDPGP
jgi:hypothetical protein